MEVSHATDPAPGSPAQGKTIESVLTDLHFPPETQKNFQRKLYTWRTRTVWRTEQLENGTDQDLRELSREFLKTYGLTFWRQLYDEQGVISDEDEETLLEPLVTIFRITRRMEEQKTRHRWQASSDKKRGRASMEATTPGSHPLQQIEPSTAVHDVGDDTSTSHDERPSKHPRITIKLPVQRGEEEENEPHGVDVETEGHKEVDGVTVDENDMAGEVNAVDVSSAYLMQGSVRNGFQERIVFRAAMWITLDRSFSKQGNFFKRITLEEHEDTFRSVLRKLPINDLQKRCVTDLAIKFGWSNESHRLSRDFRETWIQFLDRLSEARKEGETTFEMWVLVLRDHRKEIELRDYLAHSQL